MYQGSWTPPKPRTRIVPDGQAPEGIHDPFNTLGRFNVLAPGTTGTTL
jgi:hypothetical protein